MLVVASLIGLLSQPVVPTCKEMRATVAISSKSIFLDPSPENRTNATRDALRILPPRSCDFLLEHRFEAFDWVCMGNLFSLFEQQADTALIANERISLHEFYGACPATPEQRESLRVGVVLASEPLQALPYHPDPAIRAAVWRASPEHVSRLLADHSTWLGKSSDSLPRIFTAHGGRRARLNAVLGALSQKDGPALLTWVVDELTADPDPRKWDPEDVALLLFHARSCLNGTSLTCRDDQVPSGPGHRSRTGGPFREVFTRALLRMGLVRSLALMNSNGEATLDLANLGTLPDSFPLETDACLSQRENGKLIECRTELDQRAPSPDLASVREALRRLDAAQTENFQNSAASRR